MQGSTQTLRAFRSTASRATLALKDNIIFDNVEFSIPIHTQIPYRCQVLLYTQVNRAGLIIPRMPTDRQVA